jgi:hypothetical protein
MAPKKLSDVDRQDILTRYRQPEENTVTIANYYGVSTSTISRILKQNLSEDEYDSLIQKKRSGTQKSPEAITPAVIELGQPATPAVTSKPAPPAPRRRQRRQTGADVDRSEASQLEIVAIASGQALDLSESERVRKMLDQLEVKKPASRVAPSEPPIVEEKELEEIEAELGSVVEDTPPLSADDLEEDDLDEGDLEEDDLDDDDLDDDLDGSLDDEDDLEDELIDAKGFSAVLHNGEFVQVLPLSEADIPKTCYVVVDRLSELITRPLKDFADLGQIPEEETLERTLPIFDNHRVAKRFTRRMQRVVKVPDGRMFQKVRSYLQAKGITRLLIDGQVYSL